MIDFDLYLVSNGQLVAANHPWYGYSLDFLLLLSNQLFLSDKVFTLLLLLATGLAPFVFTFVWSLLMGDFTDLVCLLLL